MDLQSDIINIQIPNWDKHQSDRTPRWFKIRNDIFLDQKFNQLSSSSKLVWLYTCSLSAREESKTIQFSYRVASRMIPLRVNLVQLSVKELLKNQMLKDVSCTKNVPRKDYTRKEKTRREKIAVKPLLSFKDSEVSNLLKIITESNFEKWHGRFGDKDWISSGIVKALRYHNDNHVKGRTVEGWNRFLSNNLSNQFEWHPPKKEKKVDWATAFAEADAEMEADL